MPVPTTKKVKDNVKHWNFLLYADSGAGKTVYALKKGGKRILVMAMGAEDDGLMSAARLGTEADQIETNEWEDVMKANNDLWSPEGLEWLQDNYDILVIDSLTEMDSMIMRYILRMTREQKLSKDTDPDQPWIDDYGKRNIILEKFVRSMNDLPINVFYTALPRIAEDPDKKEFVVPAIGGNKPTDFRFAMKIVSLMTSYGYMRVEEVTEPAPTEDDPERKRKVKQRVIYWEDTSFSKGKDRTVSLTPKTVNFNIQKMALCIEGRIDRDGKPKQAERRPAVKAVAPPKKAAPQASPAPAKAVESKSEPQPAPKPEPKPAENAPEGETDDAAIDLVTTEP
ncbi:Sak4-like ssDNA annealing protein [Mycobacterium phage DrLupo]|uniref:RecA-like DNA recombinase n=1 Tax=Mycobacterium phage DrLupo TaxID=2499037 RepID=A0A3S9UQP5_9CAUD|nr:Sak4-like ssDNA annealing protein [Mycobacterium phage DrLupo]AZS12615.1 RecA-like DNA recombinase [Mycobacterium phage DrLupo]